MAKAIPKSPYPTITPPSTYRRAKANEITPIVQKAAAVAVRSALPIGKQEARNINGRIYLFVTEGHYDDHVTAPGKFIWHPGISIYVAKVEPTIDPVQIQKLAANKMIESSRSGTAISGDDIFDEQDIHDPVMGADFGDDIGAVAKARIRVKANVKAKGKVQVKSKPKKVVKRAPTKPVKPATRPSPRQPVRQTAPMSPATAPLPPVAQFDEPAETVDLTAFEAAVSDYQAPAEETPETADQGSDTYNETAIGYEIQG